MKYRIVFILNSIQHQRCVKRIQEFICRGYEVEIYGFSRGNEDFNKSLSEMRPIVLAQFDNSTSFRKSFSLMYHSMKSTFKSRKNECLVFYYFGLDVALAGCLCNQSPFLYEESDLSHTYIDNVFVRKILEFIDCVIIKKSVESVFTSEGFNLYHFGNRKVDNVSIIPNRLNPIYRGLSVVPSKFDLVSLNIGFVGGIRFESVLNIAKVIADKFPYYKFHFFGDKVRLMSGNDIFEELLHYPNVIYHGTFKNTVDLPSIYAQIDMVVATYDTKYENVKYADPNKIYEAVFFRTPILVSTGTFLEKKVKHLGIGYAIDPLKGEEVELFFKHLTADMLNSCISKCCQIPQEDMIDSNENFFDKIKEKLDCLFGDKID